MPKPTKPQFVCAVKNRRSGGVLIPGVVGDSPIQNFVWGELWAHTFEFPEGATSCFLVDGALAAGVNQASTGSNEFSGYVVPGATTGETRFSLQFYTDELVEVGPPVEFVTRTKFKVRYAELDSIPASASVDSAFIDSVEWRSDLVETLRNATLTFSSHASPKYRLLLVHYPCVGTGRAEPGSAGVTFNRIRLAADESDWSTIPGANSPTAVEVLDAYAGYPFNDNTLWLGGIGFGTDWDMWLFVAGPSASALDLVFRSLKDTVTTFEKSTTDTPWTDSYSVGCLDPAEGELLSVSISVTVGWDGSPWFENLSTLGSREFTADLTSSTVYSFPGVAGVVSVDTSHVFSPPTLTAFDGSADYSGTSSYKYANVNESGTDSAQLIPGDTGFSQFIGTGTISVSAASNHAIEITPISGVSDLETLSILIRSKTLAGGNVTLTYYESAAEAPEPTSTLSRVTPSVDILDGTTPAPRATRLVPELFTCFVKPPDYVPTARAVVASGFKPALVCAVRERVTPQPRPPYLPNTDPIGGPMADFVLDETWSYRFGADLLHDWGMQPSSSPIEQVPGVYGFTPLPGLVKSGNPHAYTLLQGWIADETITQEEYDLYYKAIFEDPFRPKIEGSPDRQSIAALSSALSFNIYGMPDAVNDPSTNTVTTYTKSFKFRITSGEWPSGTALPTEFLPEHTAQLLNVNTVGARSQLELTARNVEIQFPATATPVHRVFIVPVDTYFYGATTPGAGIWFNKVYDAEGVDVPLTAGSLGLSGRPYTGRSGLTGFSNEFHIRDYRGVDEVAYAATPGAYSDVVPYYVFITEARSDAFSVFLRSEAVSAPQNVGLSYTSNDFSVSQSATQLPAATGELRAVNATYLQHAWRFRSRTENLDAAPHTVTMDREATLTVKWPDNSTLWSSTLARTDTLLFGAFDTLDDGFGASGYIQPLDIKTETGSVPVTITAPDSRVAAFVGSGLVSIPATTVSALTITGTPSHDSYWIQNESQLSLAITYTYWQP